MAGSELLHPARRPGELWRDLACDPAELTVVMEPTRNAWIPVAAWFRRRGARVVLVPTTQSADLRTYYSKHTKNDRLDSAILARLPLLHPEGLREHVGDGPADPLRRIVKQRSSIAKRRSAIFHRLDAQLELLGPAWYDVLGTDYGKAALQFLAHYADPNAVIRLGRTTRGWRPTFANPSPCSFTWQSPDVVRHGPAPRPDQARATLRRAAAEPAT